MFNQRILFWWIFSWYRSYSLFRARLLAPFDFRLTLLIVLLVDSVHRFVILMLIVFLSIFNRNLFLSPIPLVYFSNVELLLISRSTYFIFQYTWKSCFGRIVRNSRYLFHSRWLFPYYPQSSVLRCGISSCKLYCVSISIYTVGLFFHESWKGLNVTSVT